jgi:class 3 adenylate cyclase/tetratricopeptide (TPR) repeat protein
MEGADDPLGPGNRVFTPQDRRTVTVLFADIVGSTSLIERLDAEQALAMLEPAVKTVSDSVNRYGGTVVQTLGDGLMAIFGVPLMQEDHALRACDAALDAQQRLHELAARLLLHGVNLKLRIGLNSGPVVVTAANEGGRIRYGAVGPTVHLANRIETAAEPGTIGLSEATFQLVRRAFVCRAVGAKAMKGFSDPQPLYQLLNPLAIRRTRGLEEYRITSPLIGRKAELETLRKTVTALEGGGGGVLLVVGEAGVGKSRLLAEARRSSIGRSKWLESGALSFGQGISYWPFIELLRPLFFGTEVTAAPDSWVQFQQAATTLLGEEAQDLLPYIATLLGLQLSGPEREKLRYLDGEVLGANIFRSARRLFELLATQQPLVVVFEDLHWADRSSLLLLKHVVPLAATHPILFCCLSRQDKDCLADLRSIARQELGARFREVPLSPLSVTDSQTLLASILGNQPQTRRLRDLILYKAEGNPFFMEEVIRTLIDLRVLVEEDGHWSARKQDIIVPDTIQAVILERFDRLDARLKEVLSVAAVIGRTFLYRVLSAVTHANANLEKDVEQLSAIEIIEQLRAVPELAYMFRHALTHDAIYENLLIERRRQLHASVADCLEYLFAGETGEIASILAFHYARSARWEKALQYLIAAAEQSRRMAADDEALRFYEQAIEAYSRYFGEKWEGVQRAILDGRLGEIYFRRGDHAKAVEFLSRAIAQFGDTAPSGRAAVFFATAKEIGRHVLSAMPSLESQLFDREDEAIQAHCRPYVVLGWIYHLSYPQYMPFLILRAANVAARNSSAEYVAKSLSAVGYLLDTLRIFRLSEGYHRRAVAVAERFPRPSTLAFTLHILAVHQFYAGRWPQAEQSWLRALENAELADDLLEWSNSSIMLCELWGETNMLDRVIAQGDALIKTGQDSAYQPALRWGLLARGKALRRLNRQSEAVPALENSVDLSSRARDFVCLAAAGGELAFSLIELGRGSAAEALIQRLEGEIGSRRPRFHTSAFIDIAAAASQLHFLECSGLSASALRSAQRRCATAMRSARTFRMFEPAALRLKARLALLRGRRSASKRLWQKAIASAERLGAAREAILARGEIERHFGETGS